DGRGQWDPYPKGTNHESKHKHDTTTTPEDEEAEKRKEGNEWRDRPPYRTTAENDHAVKHHEAQCNCGRIKYWLSREKPLASKYCHCTDCQSLHERSKGLAFYHAQKKHTYHDLPCKVSCAYCHAPIMDEGRNMVLMFPAIIKFKTRRPRRHSSQRKYAYFVPFMYMKLIWMIYRMHIFYSRRCLDITDGKTKWAELDDQSEKVRRRAKRV
ncbi:hypothetical protein PG994_002918, partial [Apiospora phragmitis]